MAKTLLASGAVAIVFVQRPGCLRCAQDFVSQPACLSCAEVLMKTPFRAGAPASLAVLELGDKEQQVIAYRSNWTH